MSAEYPQLNSSHSCDLIYYCYLMNNHICQHLTNIYMIQKRNNKSTKGIPHMGNHKNEKNN